MNGKQPTGKKRLPRTISYERAVEIRDVDGTTTVDTRCSVCGATDSFAAYSVVQPGDTWEQEGDVCDCHEYPVVTRCAIWHDGETLEVEG